MSDDTDNIEVRTFASIDEVRDLSGFVESNPINTDNYARIYGDYYFAEEVRCCRQMPSGNLCNEGHKYGFVAKLKDGTCTIVGNRCAKDKFGADARISADRAKYLNEKRRREGLAQLESLLSDKDEILARLDRVAERLKALQDRVSSFTSSIGELTARRLRDIARSGRPTVFVDAVNYRDYADEDGNKQRERRVAPASIGTLTGLAIFQDYTYQSVQSGVRDIRNAIQKAETITDLIKASELEALTSTIGTVANIEGALSSAEQECDAFFAGDLWLLCFILDDRAERYKVAKVVLERSGESVGKDKAKDWLTDTEQRVKAELKADKIEIK